MARARNTLDTFLIYPTADLTPGGLAEGIVVLGEAAANDAVTAFKKRVTVMRITDGHIAQIVTDDFVSEPVEEYPDQEDWTRAHSRHMSRIGSFGRRA